MKSLIPQPNNDISVFFNNNQIMARNWNVKDNPQALISVITIMVSQVPPVITTLQRNPQFKPSVWLNSIDIKEGGCRERQNF